MVEVQNSTTLDHHRLSCNDLLLNADNLDDLDSEPLESAGLLGTTTDSDSDSDSDESVAPARPRLSPRAQRRRARFVRSIALLCACCLSIGSHYASHTLGPLKSRLHRELGTSHTEFSLLLSAYSLNSTWTPLIGGVLASRLGTTSTSIFATGVILLGQVLLLVGDMYGNIRFMALGMFVFGMGVSPLAVIQETIIVRFFVNHGLGVSIALGLVAGKGASFLAARTSYTLTERWGTRAPFYVSTALATLSVIVNIIYIVTNKWLVDGAGAELESSDISEEAKRRSIHNVSEAEALEKVAEKKRVNFREITKLGDVFWAYVGMNALCGMLWLPFTHLASYILAVRYQMSERDAALKASWLLAGSLVLYPIVGYLCDRYRHRPIVIELLSLSSLLTLFTFGWLALPTITSPDLGIFTFAIGHGFSPLLLVVLVPKIVSLKYVSTALGLHKSIEQTGSTIFQTLAGLVLDTKSSQRHPDQQQGVQYLLGIFFVFNVAQLLSIAGLAYLQRKKDLTNTARRPTPSHSQSASVRFSRSEESPLRGSSPSHQRYLSASSRNRLSSSRLSSRSDMEVERQTRRGEVFAACSVGLIVFAWALFMGTAWFRLGQQHKAL